MQAAISLTTLKLRALDPNLPMLAARAAMELDDFDLSGNSRFSAVRQLADRLKNSFSGVGPSGSMTSERHSLLDSSTVALMGQALSTTESLSTVDELSTKLWDVASVLDRIASKSEKEDIESMRDFCVSLSDCAASYLQSFDELTPGNQYRK